MAMKAPSLRSNLASAEEVVLSMTQSLALGGSCKEICPPPGKGRTTRDASSALAPVGAVGSSNGSKLPSARRRGGAGELPAGVAKALKRSRRGCSNTTRSAAAGKSSAAGRRGLEPDCCIAP
eukprot:CAMPEP_0171210750 /NCGR_PEP_ID=MMETSP0790-20130122/29269_1 /TAXON_ID=2925 /ORGANISM="Alexandrium catenella, Strain OF101" /LENGTH=121 /DNA_ID=CAMNT_0011676395 /DNA_START=64 /DNA_END=429 /DNA_ORIENTATION=+